jgi:predicted transcriptional regulator
LTICEIEFSALWLPKGYPQQAQTMGEYLRQFRVTQFSTIEEVATQLNVYESTIYKWEHGIIQPQHKNIKKIIDYMGYDPRINNPLNYNNYELIEK